MKIAYITNTFYPEINGIVTSIINNSKILAKRHHIEIYTTKKSKKINLGKNIKVRYYPGTSIFTKYPEFKLEIFSLRFLKHLERFDPDIIHIHTPSIFGMEALFYAKVFKKPVVATYHTFLPGFIKHFKISVLSELELVKNVLDMYTKLIYSAANAIITPSNSMKEMLIKNGIVKDKSKIYVISNGVDVSAYNLYKNRLQKTSSSLKKSNPVVLYVGRLSYEKNLDVAINAFKLVEKDMDAEFWIVGCGPDENHLKKLASNSNIKFLGAKRGCKLLEVYSKADIFLTASTIETEGISILEAMSSRLPIVGVRKLAIPELVTHGKNGFVAKPGNVKELAKYLRILIKNKDLRKKMGNESYKKVKNYDLKQVSAKLESLYNSLLK